ncbi:LPS export ABC transporter periplasmic protein LptC [Thalassolituus sp. LLYu03]|uniref:LPS export ABC transporter periplasmic protein LptC n=1 Tax=Thalassolituus sp. LLYu03 TaxID=3421656 RepID=UPI003D2BA77A
MRKRYLLLLLTLVFGLALLAVDRYTEDFVPSLTEQQSLEPDYYGEGLLNRQYDKDGGLNNTFVAAASTHFPFSKLTEFATPVLMTRDEDGKEWQVTALSGRVNDNDHMLYLKGQVEIRPMDDAADPLLVQTDSLSYNSKTRIAETADPVTITSAQTVIQATGMIMDLDRQRIEFSQQVNTRYVP